MTINAVLERFRFVRQAFIAGVAIGASVGFTAGMAVGKWVNGKK